MATKEKTPTHVVTGKVRLSYCSVFVATSSDKDEPAKFSTAILISKKDKKTLDAINAAVEAAKQKGKAEKWGGKIPPAASLKLPLRDGDEERPEDPAYAGHYWLNAKSNTKPGIVDRDLNPVMDQSEVYSGCYARVAIDFYPFDGKSKGIAVGLNNVQKLGDGEPLGGGSRAEDDFSDDFVDTDDDDVVASKKATGKTGQSAPVDEEEDDDDLM
jgi:hypothetical protein